MLEILTSYSIAASFFYWLIAASLAELASAVPSAGGGESSMLHLRSRSLITTLLSVPLGLHHSWSPRSCCRILCGLAEFPWLVHRVSLNLTDQCSDSSLNVGSLSPRLRGGEMARLHRILNNHLGMFRIGLVAKSTHARCTKSRWLLGYRRRFCDCDRLSRNGTWAICQHCICLDGLGQCKWVGQ